MAHLHVLETAGQWRSGTHTGFLHFKVVGTFSAPRFAKQYLAAQGWTFAKRYNGRQEWTRNGDTLLVRLTRHEVDALISTHA
jgi:hypothetical protein